MCLLVGHKENIDLKFIICKPKIRSAQMEWSFFFLSIIYETEKKNKQTVQEQEFLIKIKWKVINESQDPVNTIIYSVTPMNDIFREVIS